MAGIAIVELFTSEGCAACPPADDVLARLAARRARGDRVLTLGFHVDYWDRLGWVDPFGSAASTRRQQEYETVFRTGGLYTPQAVVNGRTELVGSRGRALDRHVDRALRHGAPELAVELELSHGDLDVRTPTRNDARLVVALVQDRAVSVVTRGENAGRTLHHTDVVRGLAVGATVTLAVPPDVPAERLSLVVLCQERGGEIVAATQLPLPAPARAQLSRRVA